MEISYNLIATIDILGFLQGTVLGLVLLFMNYRKDKTKRLLALFIIAYALEILPAILEELEIFTKLSESVFTPLNFNWLLFPLFYVYVQSVSILSKEINYLLLKIGVVALLIESLLFFLYWQGVFIPVIINKACFIVEISFGIFVSVKLIRLINKHVKELNNQYSYVENKELLWAKRYAFIGVLYTVAGLPLLFWFEGQMIYLIFSILNIVLLYWVSLRGVLQPNIKSLISKKISKEEESFKETQEAKEPGVNKNFITVAEMKSIMEKTEYHLRDSETFRKVDLTISDVANAIAIHPKRLSASINSERGTNFNAYINQHRVDKAKEMLKGKEYSYLSIEGIGFEVGFHSKTTFYNAFKKNTNMTPNAFRLTHFS